MNKIRSIRIQKTLDSKTRTGGGGRRVSQGKLRYTCASCLRQKFLTAHRQLSSSSSPKRHPVQVTKIKCGTKFLRVLIFVIFPAIGKNKIYANKNYRRQTEISYTKKIVLRNRVCSITHCLFHSETKQYSTKNWFVFLLLVLNKNKNIINAGYWVLSENRKN